MNRHKNLVRPLLAAIAVATTLGVARAGTDEAVKALQAKDFATAASEARKGAEAGDARAYVLLAMMYQAGNGVAKDPRESAQWYEKAADAGVSAALAPLALAYFRGDGVTQDKAKGLALARRSAGTGDPYGQFFVFAFLSGDKLNYLGAQGKPDRGRYAELAGRPLDRRGLDSEARDALYRSANRGFPLAQSTLAMAFGATVGEGNRQRMSELLAKLPGQTAPNLEIYRKVSKFMDKVGESFATPQIFVDAQVPQMISARIKACGVKDKPAPGDAMPKLVATSITRPLESAVYLPSEVAGYERAYLLAGNWEEEWKYEACGKTVAVNVKFVADGLGGAVFQSVIENVGKATETRATP